MRRIATLVVACSLATTMLFTTGGIAQAQTEVTSSSFTGIPITATSDTQSFTGTLDITRFVVQNGTIKAVGTVTGELTDLATGVTQTIEPQTVTLTLLDASGTCKILHLELGPLDLDLLGLKVHLDKVVLDITAQSGPGNLLGNLLCSVAHLLDSSGNLTGIVRLLNQILAIVG